MRRIYVKRLRGMCTLCPLSEFEAHGCLSRCGERRRVGDTSVQAPTLEIHRKQRLPTDTAEETDTPKRLSQRCTRISHTCIYLQCFYFPRSVIIDSVLLFSCTLEIHRKQRLPTDTAEETETRLGACPSAVLESRIHAFIYNVSTFHVLL